MTPLSGIVARGPLGGIRRTVSRGIRDERGVAAVEFALILTFLVFIVGGIIDFSRYIWARTALQEVVADASRCVALYQTDQNFFTSANYTVADPSDIIAPCSSLSTYASTVAAGRGVGVTLTVTPTTSTMPTDTSGNTIALSSNTNTTGTTYHTFYEVQITATFQSIFGLTPNRIGTTVYFPYCTASCTT